MPAMPPSGVTEEDETTIKLLDEMGVTPEDKATRLEDEFGLIGKEDDKG